MWPRTGRNADAQIVNSSFYLTGESAIVLLGKTNFIDGTAGEFPTGTKIVGNYARALGVYGKQISFVFQALSARTTIEGNIAFDGPRAAVVSYSTAAPFFGAERPVQNYSDNMGWCRRISMITWVAAALCAATCCSTGYLLRTVYNCGPAARGSQNHMEKYRVLWCHVIWNLTCEFAGKRDRRPRYAPAKNMLGVSHCCL